MIKRAKFSECGKYRYVLTRQWDVNKKMAMCIGLNPSTANAEEDDPTIESLIRVLTYNGYGGFYMTNLFAIISTDPDVIRATPDPLGENDKYLISVRTASQEVIFCWGNFKQAQYRAKKITSDFLFDGSYCFGKNKNGSPKHPLYLKSTTKLIPYGESK